MIALSPKGEILFRKIPFAGIEIFSLPRKMIYEVGHVLRIGGSGCDDRCSLRLAARNFADRTLREQIVQLRL